MHIADFWKKPDAQTLLRNALSYLYQANFFSVWLEIAARRNAASTTNVKTLEGMAVRAAWNDGYQEAIWDLYYFFEHYKPTDENIDVRPDFGARDFLLKTKHITQEEYDQLGIPTDAK